MTARTSSIIAIGALAFGLGLAACKKQPSASEVARMDRELVGNAAEADAGLTGPLQDQIVVNSDLPRAALNAPGKAPLRAPSPAPASGKVTLGELATIQAGNTKAKGCDRNFQYGAAWANRLPAAIPLYPGARVSEAAGNDSSACRLRIVSFTSAAPMQTLIDYYYTAAIRAGYSSEHQEKDGEHILAGVRESDDGAYYLSFANRAGGGTTVDLIANNGR
jgi:hypothetical protein